MFWSNIGGTLANLLWVALGTVLGWIARGVYTKYVQIPK